MDCYHHKTLKLEMHIPLVSRLHSAIFYAKHEVNQSHVIGVVTQCHGGIHHLDQNLRAMSEIAEAMYMYSNLMSESYRHYCLC